AAYFNNRICATPDAKHKCFPNPPKRCHFKDAGENERRGYHCKWREEREYADCRGEDGVEYPPITVRLNDPCSLIDNTHPLCTGARAAPKQTKSEPSSVNSSQRGCGSCSLEGTRGALLPASIAAILALLLAERRRRRRG